ncbi:MAG: hypothetical protein F6K58_04720 [Symploca sp. SIO2E9]|nr:hypothetical protein [Symploca sp. SIO2E9]
MLTVSPLVLSDEQAVVGLRHKRDYSSVAKLAVFKNDQILFDWHCDLVVRQILFLEI